MQLGEKVRLLVKVKNIGQGAAVKTEAILRNGPGQEGILISAGRFEAKDLAAGRQQDLLLHLRGRPRVPGRRLPAGADGRRLGAGRVGHRQDQDQGGRDSSITVEPASGTVTAAKADVALREAPAADALVVGKAGAGRRLQGDRQGGRLHPGRARDRPPGLRGHQRPASRAARPSLAFQPDLAGDAAGAGGERAHAWSTARRSRSRAWSPTTCRSRTCSSASTTATRSCRPRRSSTCPTAARRTSCRSRPTCRCGRGQQHHPGVRPRDQRDPERRHPDRPAASRAQPGAGRAGARCKDETATAGTLGAKPGRIQNGRSGIEPTREPRSRYNQEWRTGSLAAALPAERFSERGAGERAEPRPAGGGDPSAQAAAGGGRRRVGQDPRHHLPPGPHAGRRRRRPPGAWW